MYLNLRYGLQIPNEILDLILSKLDFESRKSSRFVCREFNTSLRLLLFRSLSVSLYPKHLHRFEYFLEDEQLRNAVEELVWDEIPFKGRPPSEEIEPLIRALCKIRVSEEEPDLDHPSQINVVNLWTRLKRGYDQTFQETTLEIDELIGGLMDAARMLLSRALRRFGRLRRFTTRDCLDGGILCDTPFSEEVRVLIGDDYPISDGVCRLLVHYDSDTQTPALGLSAMLETMVEHPESRIEALVTERITGLMKTGVPISFFRDTSNKYHFDRPAAFSNLRRISLAVCNIPIEQTEYTIEEKEIGLFRNLAAAKKLESLHLSSTYGYIPPAAALHESIYRASLRILGVTDQASVSYWPNLKHLILESFAFEETKIYQLLHRHAETLRNLTLWNCSIRGNGTWPSLLHSVSQDPDIRFDALTIKAPDYVYVDWASQFKPPEMIAGAQIPDEVLLEYVNNKDCHGKHNPFAAERLGPGNDYSYADAEDLQGLGLLEWDPKEDEDPVFDNHTESDHNSDGPEYISDSDEWPDNYRYEQDEDSDVEMADADDVSDHDSVVITGARSIHERLTVVDLTKEDD